MTILGLRIGNTNTTAAVTTGDGRSRDLLFDGRRVLPSVVALHSDHWLVGQSAKSMQRKVSADIFSHFWRDVDTPLEVHGDRFMPSQILTMLVKEARKQAEAEIGQPIHKCSLSVPAHFSERDKNALRDAIPEDMELLGIAPDPICAVVASNLSETETRTALVVRMGGTSLDVALVSNTDGCMQVLSIGGEQNTGGADLTRALAKWYAATQETTEFEQIRDNDSAWVSLLEEADRAKCTLSVQEDAVMGPIAFGDGQLTEPKRVTRNAFEAMCEAVARRFEDAVGATLGIAEMRIGVPSGDVHTVLFHGGCANVPFLSKRLEAITVSRVAITASPTTDCARGAAIIGHLRKHEEVDDESLCCCLVSEEEIGIRNADGGSIPVFQQGTSLPVARKLEMRLDLATDEIRVPVYRGQHHLGDLVAHFPQPAAPGSTILLEFQLDINGGLSGRVSIPQMQWETQAALTGAGEATGHIERLPPCALDSVHFTITAPPVMSPATDYELAFWAHLERQRTEVMARAKEQTLGGNIKARSVGPAKVSRGSLLTVSMQIRGLSVDPPSAHISWEGEIGSATFLVGVPSDATPGTRAGKALVCIDGLRLATVTFLVRIEMAVSEVTQLPSVEKQVRRAFASYASKDRDNVLARVQGIQKAAPSMDIFLDVVKLRSGQHWQSVLRDEICSRDILYLFWSESARSSKWVDWEWRCALQHHGIDGIDPVPLVSPDVAPPPQELASHLHFNDWTLAYMATTAIRGMRQQEDALDGE